MKYFLNVFILCLLIHFSKAQQEFKGVILDRLTGKPIEFATVSIAKKIIITNENGHFSLSDKNISNNKVMLHISATGYETKDTFIIPSRSIITIYLFQKQLLLQPVEVTAIRAGDRSPFTKTNLTKTFIEKNNTGQDIPFILNQTPNVVVNSDAGNGIGYTGIRIRGTDATRINMTINGIPYNDAESQGVFFVDLPDFASSVSSIQIQRGVGTSSNGSGAFGASMNFSTNEYNDKTYIEFNNSYGSFNTWKNTVKIGSGLVGKHFTLDGRFSNIKSDGFIDRAFSRLQSGHIGSSYWSKKTTIRFNIILGKEKTYQAWNGIPENILKINRTYNSSGTEKPGDPYANETDNYWQNHYQLFWNQKINDNWNFNTALFYTTGRGYYEQYKANKTLTDYGIQPIVIGTDTIRKSDIVRRLWLDNNYYGQIFSLQQKKEKQQFTIGGGWNKYLGNHYGEVSWTKIEPTIQSKYYNNNAYKIDLNVYAKWQQKISAQLELFTDLQYRHVRYNIDGFRDNPGLQVNTSYNFINPKAGLSYFNHNWSGFISYAIANKEPNRNDFEASIAQQPKREQLHDLELNIKRKNIINGLDIATTFYYMLYKDQLILTGKVNDVGAYTRNNIPNSYRTGIELEANYNTTLWNASYSISISRNKIKNFTEYIDDYDNYTQQAIYHGTTDISFSPSVVQNLTVNLLPAQNVELTWLGKYVSKQYLDNTSTQSRQLKAYLVNDARAIYTLHDKLLKTIRVIFQINNLFNVKYEPNGYIYSSYISGGSYIYNNYYFPMAGRNFLLALNIKI